MLLVIKNIPQNNSVPKLQSLSYVSIQELLGHKNLQTTMIYTHVMNKGPLGVKSPGDSL